MTLANLSIYYTRKNIKSEYNNNKFKVSAESWNDTFDLSDGCYSISYIQDYFEFIIKKHETLAENPPIQIYPNKIKNRIVFKIKTGYKLKLLTPETMKLLGSMDTTTKTGIDPAKTASKRVVQNTAEAIGDLIGNKIADKITSIGKPKEKEKTKETKETEEIFIPPEKRQQIIDDLRFF